jgi:hypothetical protein
MSLYDQYSRRRAALAERRESTLSLLSEMTIHEDIGTLLSHWRTRLEREIDDLEYYISVCDLMLIAHRPTMENENE